MNKYIDMFDKYAEVKAILENPAQLDALDPRNKVAAVVNWFEVVSACYLNGSANHKILESLGFPEICKSIYKAVVGAKRGDGARAFDDERVSKLVHLRRVAADERPTGGL